VPAGPVRALPADSVVRVEVRAPVSFAGRVGHGAFVGLIVGAAAGTLVNMLIPPAAGEFGLGAGWPIVMGVGTGALAGALGPPRERWKTVYRRR